MTNKLSKVVLLVSLLLLGSYSVATPSDNSSDDSDILDLVMFLLPALAKSQISILDAEEEGFKVSLDKIDISGRYSYKLAINKPYTKDIECYLGNGDTPRLGSTNLCSVSAEYSGRVGQHSIDRGSIDLPSGNYFLTIIDDVNQELRSELFHIPPKQPTYEIGPPSYTILNSVEVELKGEPNTTVIVNGDNKGVIPVSGKATIALDTSGEIGIKEFVIALMDDQGGVSEVTYPVSIKKMADIESIELIPNSINIDVNEEIALSDTISFRGSILSAADYGFNRIVIARITYKDGTEENLPAIDLNLEISDESVARISVATGSLPSGISIKMPVLQGLKAGSATLVAGLGGVASDPVSISVPSEVEEDKVPPQILLHGYNPTTLLVGERYHEYSAIAVDDVDGLISVKKEGEVDTNSEGSYKITYTATDGSGNTATSVREVIVVNTNSTNPSRVLLFPPYLSLVQGEVVALQTEVTFPDVGVKEIDDLGFKGLAVFAYYDNDHIPKLIPAKDVVLTIGDDSILERSTGTVTDTVSSSSTTIPVLSALKAGSVSVTATLGTAESPPMTITVKQLPPDTTAPVITLKGSVDISLIEGSSFVDEGATAIDGRDGEVEVSVSGVVDPSTAGVYTLSYTAKDNAGNISSLTRIVEILEYKHIDIDSINNLELNISDVCRGGGEIEIIGRNLPIDNLVIKLIPSNSSSDILEIIPVSQTSQKIIFKCPESIAADLEWQLRVESGNKTSFNHNIYFLENSYPIIKEITLGSDKRTLLISGEGLASELSIFMNGELLSDENYENDPALATFKLDNEVTSGYFYLENRAGHKSNSYLYYVNEEIKIIIDNGAIDEVSVFSADSVSTIESTNIVSLDKKNEGNYSVIFSKTNENKLSYSSVSLFNNEEVVLSSKSTAISLVFQALHIRKSLSVSGIQEVINKISSLNEVSELSELIEYEINSDGFYEIKNNIKLKLESAITAASESIYMDPLTLAQEGSVSENNNFIQPLAFATKEALSSNKEEVAASITPSSISGFSLSENPENSGNIIIDNTNYLPYAYKLTTLNDSPIDNSYNSRGFSRFFTSHLTEVNNVNYRSSKITIITPGMQGVSELNEEEKIIRNLLGNSFFYAFARNSDLIGSDARKIISEYEKDQKGREIPTQTYEKFAYDLLSYATTVAKVTLEATKAKKVIDAIDFFLSQYDRMRSESAALSTPAKIVFEIIFPVSIDSIEPNKIFINMDASNYFFTIRGKNLRHNADPFAVLYNAHDKATEDPLESNLSIKATPKYISDGTMVELSEVSLDKMREVFAYYTKDNKKSELPFSASLGVGSDAIDLLTVVNSLKVSDVTPAEEFSGQNVILSGDGFSSETEVALGNVKNGEFEPYAFFELSDIQENKISMMVPDRVIGLNDYIEEGDYEVRARVKGLPWSNSVNFKIPEVGINIGSVSPSEINIENDTIVSVFLSCYSGESKIDCDKISKYKEPDYSRSGGWFDHQYFLTYHEESEFVIEFTGFSKSKKSKYIKSKLVDIKDNGNHLRFKILSEDIVNRDSYNKGYLFHYPYLSARLVMNMNDETKKVSKDDAIVISQKFGTLGYYDFFERYSSPSSNPEKWESDKGMVGRWDDALYWSPYHDRYISGSFVSGTGPYEETYDRVSEYCNEKGMQLPTYQDFSELIDPSADNLVSTIFQSYFFSTTSYYGSAYWLRNGNRIVQNGLRVYEQDANLFKDKYVYHTDVKCIQ